MATKIFLGKPPKYIEDWYKSHSSKMEYDAESGQYAIPVGDAGLSAGTYSVKYVDGNGDPLGSFGEIKKDVVIS